MRRALRVLAKLPALAFGALAAHPAFAETAAVISHVEAHAWADESYTLKLTMPERENARDLDLEVVITCNGDFPAWDMVLFLDGDDTGAVPLDAAGMLYGTPYPVLFATGEIETGGNWEWSRLKPGSLMGTPAMAERDKIVFRDFAQADWLRVSLFRATYTFNLARVRATLSDFDTKCLVLHHR